MSGRCRRLSDGVWQGLCRWVLSHYRRRKLAFAKTLVSVTLHACSVQLRSTAAGLKSSGRLSLVAAPLLGSAFTAAVALARVAGGTKPDLGGAQGAGQKSPGFLGAHGDAEAMLLFLDNPTETSDTHRR
jgi:hypothetical protein